jgi:succinate dehydrogenase membrane anchor subunit
MKSMRTPLGRVRGLGSAKSGTEDFWRQRLTAMANIPLVIAGVVIVISLVGRNHAAAAQILGSPLIAILMLLFVLSVTYHMRIGMQVIIEDYVHEEKSKLALIVLNTFYAITVALVAAFAILKLAFGV